MSIKRSARAEKLHAINRQGLISVLQRPIAFHRVFAQISGSVTAGLFFSQLFYWHDKGSDPDGWIYKTYSEWTEETTMSRKELDTARRKLKALGLLKEKLCGVPAVLHYRINFDQLTELLNYPTDPTNCNDQKSQTSLTERDKLESPKGTNSLIYTEITSETTSSGGKAKKSDDDAEKPTANTPDGKSENADPFFTGQHRAIAREVVKVARQIQTPRNFITDAPWGRLAEEIGKDATHLFQEFEKFLMARYSDKSDPDSYAKKICSSLYEKPGSELACKPWLEFADYFRKNLSAPPAPKKSEPRQVEIEQIPDREASKEAFRRLKG